MSIQSTTFGGVRLSGKEAEAFERAVEQAEPKQAAKDALVQGKAMLEEYEKEGQVIVQVEIRDE